MNKLYLLLIIGIFGSCNITQKLVNPSDPFTTPFEKDNEYSSSYYEAITFYNKLASSSEFIQVNEFGMTDSGQPLHEVIISDDQNFSPLNAIQKGKAVLLINNGIHAGEPCGIDASMMMARDLVNKNRALLKEVVVVIIPVYNVGGSINRGRFSRANQNGPKEYGFRGNAKNLDLNRDFIKQDSENAKSFNRLFNKWNPDVFIDNHTSNGADYQYVITLIATQKDKLEFTLSDYMTSSMLPELYKNMNAKGYEMTPYVFSRTTPDEGIAAFLDLPRYSSGYAALHNTISFMPETHMFKPYKDRVKSTYLFTECVIEFINSNKTNLFEARNTANRNTSIQDEFDLAWQLDQNQVDEINFKGYESRTKKSKVTGEDRMYYDRKRPFEKTIPFYNSYSANITIEKPNAYIVPQAYMSVIDRLKINGVHVEQISADQKMELEVYRIEDYQSRKTPYEGHYLHTKVEVSKSTETIQIHRGDYMIKTDQIKNRYIIETLEPQAPDSYFAWNFFDGILMQKEYFSSYVFEELAEDILKKDPMLKKEFEEKKKADKDFRKNSYGQLDFIYKRSPYYEKTYKRYPVYRVIN